MNQIQCNCCKNAAKKWAHQFATWVGKKRSSYKFKIRKVSEIKKNKVNTEAKLHFAYTSKNMTDNATGKNWMSKTLSLQSFSGDARQLWVILTSIRKTSLKTSDPAQVRILLFCCWPPSLSLRYRSMIHWSWSVICNIIVFVNILSIGCT